MKTLAEIQHALEFAGADIDAAEGTVSHSLGEVLAAVTGLFGELDALKSEDARHD